ncbi:MAG: hypothetical protein HQL46_05095 [Gammaproteobacteria bacterium]|nr:hypothetical protein [Gammaproteobacteria bacterium]
MNAKDDIKSRIDSVEYLYAIVHAMKCESEDRLQDLADCLENHHNKEAEDIFRQAINLIQKSIDGIEYKTSDLSLPSIPPWEYQSLGLTDPDCHCMENAHYLMSAKEALNLTIVNEERISYFLEQLKRHTDSSIIEVAENIVKEEKQLLAEMATWHKDIEESEPKRTEDFDPPNMPE